MSHIWQTLVRATVAIYLTIVSIWGGLGGLGRLDSRGNERVNTLS